jgi:hypothetical protein
MWQKCPICNGSGKVANILSSSSFEVCSTCNGSKIISKLTGLPPNLDSKFNNQPGKNVECEVDDLANAIIAANNNALLSSRFNYTPKINKS